MTFRELKLSDKDMVRRFFDNMSEKSASFFNVNHGNEKRTMEFFYNGKTDHKFFIAYEDNEIVSLSFIWDIDTSIPWLGIAVADKYHGKGIGTSMINYVSEYLTSEGYGGILLRTSTLNHPAQRLYEKCGFERIGTHPSGEYLYIKRWNSYDKN